MTHTQELLPEHSPTAVGEGAALSDRLPNSPWSVLIVRRKSSRIEEE
ncbi:hypothetical protein [Streptomyces sp. H27-S2]|nr:hypothetical protein [Streptomyces sp. H27-S2]MCY0953653.1 hypothetical protein [Streptomyces sp. H27-S2]